MDGSVRVARPVPTFFKKNKESDLFEPSSLSLFSFHIVDIHIVTDAALYGVDGISVCSPVKR